MSPNHFHIPLPHPSTFSHNLPHPHRSSTNKSQLLPKTQSLPNEHSHVDTPHPHTHSSSPVSYLDAHVPPFAKHHQEFQINHAFREGKREARHASNSSQIPEYILEAEEPEGHHVRTSEEIARDQAEWEAIAQAREAARRRVTINLMTERMNGDTKMESVVMMGRVESAMTVGSEAMGSSESEGSVSPN